MLGVVACEVDGDGGSGIVPDDVPLLNTVFAAECIELIGDCTQVARAIGQPGSLPHTWEVHGIAGKA